MEWQIRNWLYFAWLSGDHIVEQHVHNLDVCNWVMGTHPVKASSLGGRQARTDAAYGHIFDHFATEYTYEDGTKLSSQCRQIDGCSGRVEEYIVGSKGTSNACTYIKGESSYNFSGKNPNPYVLEHVRLYKSIRSNEGFNEGVQVAHSTLTAIMGRMSAYSGQEVTWDQALNSPVVLMPEKVEFGPLPVAQVAIPGHTKGVF
jgi:predicted dehydrogenase